MSASNESLCMKPDLSVRLVVADHYMTKPLPGIDVIYSEFRGSDIKQVPVLRIFGPTPSGRKACVHVHGVFPYFYVPCGTSQPEPGTAYQIASSLDKALNISLKQASSTNQHVYKITLVKGVPFYGYHNKEHLFYKIFLYSPGLMKQAADLLQNGAILGQVFQPHEAHLNFTLQFFIDFNLFGMSYIDFQHLKYRRNGTEIYDTVNDIKPESMCYYEADCIASHILNRSRVKGDVLENPGLEEVWKQEYERRKKMDMSLSSRSLTQGRIDLLGTESHMKFKSLFSDKIKDENDNLKFDCTYPAESVEGSQVSKVGDVTIHQSDASVMFDGSEFDTSVVDESIVMDVSQRYSQVTLNSDDLDLLNVLKDMDENRQEDIGNTNNTEHVNNEGDLVDSEDDDLEYTQVFDEERLLLSLSQHRSGKSNEDSSPQWEDSFWDGVSITQLDGTFDDEHTKKVRKRKRLRTVGLSKPKRKHFNYTPLSISPTKSCKRTTDDADVINNSQNEVQLPFRVCGYRDECVTSKHSETNIDSNTEIRNIPKNNERKQIKNNVIQIESIETVRRLKVLSDLNEKESCLLENTVDNTIGLEHCNNTNNRDIPLKSIFNEIPKDIKNCEIDSIINEQNIEELNSSESFRFSPNEVEFDDNIQSISPNDLINDLSDDEIKVALLYDKEKQFNPQPGTSKTPKKVSDYVKQLNFDDTLLDTSSSDSTDVKTLGIKSFYDVSKIFSSDSEDIENDKVPITNKETQKSEELGNNSVEEQKYNVINNLFSSNDGEVEKTLSEAKVDSKETILNKDMTEMFCTKPDKIDMKAIENTSQTKETVKILDDKSDLETEFHLKYSDSDSVNSNNSDNDASYVLTSQLRPPSTKDVINSLRIYNIPEVHNKEPFFSKYTDVGSKIEVGNLTLKLISDKSIHQKAFEKPFDGIKSLEEWRHDIFTQNCGCSEIVTDLREVLASNRRCVLEPIFKAPTTLQVKDWIRINDGVSDVVKDFTPAYCDEIEEEETIGLNEMELSQANVVKEENAMLNESVQVSMHADGSFLCFGSVVSQSDVIVSQQSPAVDYDYLTVLILEVFSNTRGILNPNPQHDQMTAIFYTVTNDTPKDHVIPQSITNIVLIDDDCTFLSKCGINHNIIYVNNEMELIKHILDIIRLYDPDILTGYEIEYKSWGYFLERCQVLGLDVLMDVSRITEKNRQKQWKSDANDYEGKIIGRIIFNVWRLLRHEIALTSYSFESTMYHVLKERVPSYTCEQLTHWWCQKANTLRWITVEYYLTRLSGTLRIMEKLDLINRTSELARLFGLQWWEVLSRGSQFRVESLMLRAARPLNLVALSPSVRQRAAMKAPEVLPLIFEPASRFYKDPVIVLDFQSLYPSMMIAYNYCFSTCIGNVNNIKGNSAYEFGAWRLRIPKAKLESLMIKDQINWSPVGVGFIKPEVRKGVLPTLLKRILAARLAVKKSMRMQTDEAVKRAMHSRQLGLKLIANVTYGYTAANFSGRMPCVEIGDSVVSKGRETLERAIRLVKENTHWNVKVVYGDTDSMFVQVIGADRKKAFEIGQQIADAVTADNPSPVLLKLEKVYQPCILQTKKRYVGFMYESVDQMEPVYEAKGIETVRRDGCPAGVKLLQNALMELFSSADMSRVKSLVCKVLSDLVDGRMPIHDLFFTREFHGFNGYRPGAAAPPLEIAKREIALDPRGVPPTRWRVAWCVCAGPPGCSLLKLSRTPREICEQHLTPYTAYYATRVLLPPLHRCLSLLGQDVFQWYSELPHAKGLNSNTGGGISVYLRRERCTLCGGRSTSAVCYKCASRAYAILPTLTHVSSCTRSLQSIQKICMSCSGHSIAACKCINYECPIYWRRYKLNMKLSHTINDIKTLPRELTDIGAFDF